MNREATKENVFLAKNMVSVTIEHDLPIADCLFILRSDVLKLIDKIFDYHEAETTQLKERIAELEAELELCEKVHMSVHDENQENIKRIAELEEFYHVADACRENYGRMEAELQELKSGVIAEFDCTARQSDTGQVFMEYVEGMYDNVQPEQTYTVTIKSKD